ncbi:MAG: hypothetical protein AAGA77_08735 [Bacteroidota bacterium]
MKTQNNALVDGKYALPSHRDVKKLKYNWQKCLPILLGDLFTRVTEYGIERYDTYKLADHLVDFIRELNDSHGGHNVYTVSVIMGKRDAEDNSHFYLNSPSNNIFIPILEIVLHKAQYGHKVYYFYLEPMNKQFSLSYSNRSQYGDKKNDYPSTLEEDISPKVAELFIVKWQSIGDTELIEAFDCLAPKNTLDVPSHYLHSDETLFTQQKLLRVIQYNFDALETKAIFKRMDYYGEVNFYINLGAGLSVSDYHPFSFRPIITIEKKHGGRNSEDDIPPTTYFDTSRPCPPFCKPEEEC